jgi:ABC-type multidrug transport system fused ATPase/permease subunit
MRGLLWLIYGAAFNAKCEFSNLATYGNSAVIRSMYYMIGETFIMIPLTWYLESVLSTGGSAKPYLFPCIELKQWFDSRRKDSKKGETNKKDMTETLENGEISKSSKVSRENEPDDVKKERVRAEAGGDNQAVRVIGFQKVFYGRGGVPDKIAVRDLSFAVNKNECFGLLGHNGAGCSNHDLCFVLCVF